MTTFPQSLRGIVEAEAVSSHIKQRDCFVAHAPRNDIKNSQGLLRYHSERSEESNWESY